MTRSHPYPVDTEFVHTPALNCTELMQYHPECNERHLINLVNISCKALVLHYVFIDWLLFLPCSFMFSISLSKVVTVSLSTFNRWKIKAQGSKVTYPRSSFRSITKLGRKPKLPKPVLHSQDYTASFWLTWGVHPFRNSYLFRTPSPRNNFLLGKPLKGNTTDRRE